MLVVESEGGAGKQVKNSRAQHASKRLQ